MPAPYEDLRAWQLCHELALTIRRHSRSWSKEDSSLVSQLRRASFSSASNIVEGSTKKGPRELRRYLDISLGSLAEVEYGLRFARDATIIDAAEWDTLNQLRKHAHATTRLLYNAICRSINKQDEAKRHRA